MFEQLAEEVKNYLPSVSHESTVFLGCDSQMDSMKVNGQWIAKFTVVVVVHKDNRHGCKIFAASMKEPVYDTKKGNPSYRLMKEVQHVTDLYIALAPSLEDRNVEIHLDINADKKYGSSVVVQNAIGYVKGVTQIDPKIKPDAWAATHAADHAVRHPDQFTTVNAA